MADFITVTQGDAPLLVSLPHTGISLPADIAATLVAADVARFDTDWWIDLLYDFAAGLGATIVHTAMSRTVIDVNRDPAGATLYPGQATTGLCPTTTFDGADLYLPGQNPNETEISRRRQQYFAPYHTALTTELTRLRAAHPHVVLYDCHSIRPVIPRLFPGRLPDFNIGSNSGAACAPELTETVSAICAATGRTHTTNGRFKGGWITRNNGAPAAGIHAIQMELACATYMDETLPGWPTAYNPAYAAPLRATLTNILTACIDFARKAKP